MELTSDNVMKVFQNCLFKDEEVESGEAEKIAVRVDGITYKIGFHPDRLKENTGNITDMLKGLPELFFEGSGGGWSFLNLCMDKDGKQWTGLHRVCEQLMMLGVAIKKVEYTMPRVMWQFLPGCVPYVRIKV